MTTYIILISSQSRNTCVVILYNQCDVCNNGKLKIGSPRYGVNRHSLKIISTAVIFITFTTLQLNRFMISDISRPTVN